MNTTIDWFEGKGPYYWAGNRFQEASPAQIYGSLFIDVQRSGIFSDQKTFVDCVPKEDPQLIRERYRVEKAQLTDPAALRKFVTDHFLVPETSSALTAVNEEKLEGRLQSLWELLRRDPDVAVKGSSLLPLAHPYVIPGGRFREIYYWDSYFTMLGLRESGRMDLIRSMIDNFVDLIRRHGLIPNGNRTYYLTRSQPPALALMLEFLVATDGEEVYRKYLPALQAELDYWSDPEATGGHSVQLPEGGRLQRFYDHADFPRLEAFGHDEALSLSSTQNSRELFRNLRSAAESGWDFSSRWFIGGDALKDTRTTEVLPVDLNCFLLNLERTLAQAYHLAGAPDQSRQLEQAVADRLAAINRCCWSESDGYFFDYHPNIKQRSPHFTIAGVAPLFFRIASQAQADAVAETLKSKFLQPGGLVTTLTKSGEQWDWPNGWAPMQWMAIAGLENYGHSKLAAEIAHRWIHLNVGVHARTGRFMEKYNVVDLSLPAGGGEYPTQDGFGWTNGVLLKLMRDYPPLAV